MKIMRLISPIILSASSLSLSFSAYAQQLNDSTFFTGQPPLFVGAQTPDSTVNWPNAHYYFTFHLPNNSVESLGKVTIQQQENVSIIPLDSASTYAFIGTQGNVSKPLAIQTTQDPQTQAVTVVFNPPVPPGTTFTIRLEAQRNPPNEGTYLYSVTTFPAGNNPTGLPMGVGRLSFYRLF
jgi:hypothetical protein